MGKELLGSLELNRIYQQECLEGMKLIPDTSIDMILCDLPYGTTQNKWDSIISLDQLWSHYKRIIKDNGAIVLFAQAPFDKLLGCSNLEWLRYEWVWRKNIATGHLSVRWMPMKDHENILVFYKKPPNYYPQMNKGEAYLSKRKKINDSGSNYNQIERTVTINKGIRYPKTVLEFDREIGFHPTQKPVSLCSYLIRTYTNVNEIVLDNCMGSGTTAVAALKSNRRFIGFETESKYIEIANLRIESVFIEISDS